MLTPKVWIPILIILLAVIGGLFYGQLVNNQPASTRFIPVETPQKPPPPGETHETGHWHGDYWHKAPPHEGPVAPPEAEAEQTPTPDAQPTETTWDSQTAYQELREKYPKQTQNPPPFENLSVNLWDFEATKKAFMDNFNFYMKHYDPKEGWSHTRELRIAAANMSGIRNAAKSWVGLFTPEQRAEIHEMHRRYFEFKGVKVNHDRVWELVHKEGYTVSEALRISREEGSN